MTEAQHRNNEEPSPEVTPDGEPQTVFASSPTIFKMQTKTPPSMIMELTTSHITEKAPPPRATPQAKKKADLNQAAGTPRYLESSREVMMTENAPYIEVRVKVVTHSLASMVYNGKGGTVSKVLARKAHIQFGDGYLGTKFTGLMNIINQEPEGPGEPNGGPGTDRREGQRTERQIWNCTIFFQNCTKANMELSQRKNSRKSGPGVNIRQYAKGRSVLARAS